MKGLWTMAAAAALCVLATGAWGAPEGGQLELVARHHHHRPRGSEETGTSSRHHRRHAAASDETSSRRGRHGRRHGRAAATEEEQPIHGRHGRRGHAAPSDIHVEGGGRVKVGRHETLETIAKDQGLSVSALARLNHLRRPYHVHRGQSLKLPERRYYVVKDGDTLYSIARKFGVEATDLSSFNSIESARNLHAGQKIYLPGEARETARPVEEEILAPERRTTPRYLPPSVAPTLPAPSQPPYARPGPATPLPQGPVAPPSSPSVSSPPPSSSQGFQLTPQGPTTTPSGPIVQSSPAASASDVAAAGKGKFIWPVSGALISGFGPKTDGQRNDGLNLSGAIGDPVRAAADGEVVYAGDQVPSFGNLVLIKHPGGWVTAYAHMSRILVKNRDQVVQGQQIGAVGQTGSVTSPQLHFEIRYAPSPKDKATPVDPTLVLPQRETASK